MSIVYDKDKADTTLQPNGQQREYLALSPEERAKGFVRQVRYAYVHVGTRPKYPTRPLTAEEQVQYGRYNYVAFEPYPEGESSIIGRYWTQEQLDSGCGGRTTMNRELAETYARQPDFYGGTFCAHCRKHLPVGENGEFVWEGTQERVGT